MAKKKKKKARKAAKAAKGKRAPARAKKSKKAKKAKKAVVRKAPKRKAAKKTKRPTAKKAAKRPAKKARKSKAKTKDVIGEGNYTASRNFRENETSFIRNNRGEIAARAKEAEAALEGPEGAELRRADEESGNRGQM